MSKYVLLSIDPGLNGTGWALWGEDGANLPFGPVETGVINASSGRREWIERAEDIARAVVEIANRCKPDKVVMELPRFMQSGGGQTTAASGALVKLVFTVGSIWSLLRHQGHTVIDISPNAWKGQLPKNVTEKRIRTLLPRWTPNLKASHESDAVGIGLHTLGIRL